MQWIGITGPMGSGKSTVAAWLRTIGFEVLDADQEAKKVLAAGTPGALQVIQTFGQNLLSQSGDLDRRALGRTVFADPAKLLQLEAIVHPHVQQAVQNRRKQFALRGDSAAFYDVPLLFEKNLQNQFDAIMVVTADENIRRQRVKQRSHLSDLEILERNSRQLPAAVKESLASVVVHNNDSPAELQNEILSALKKLGISLPASANP